MQHAIKPQDHAPSGELMAKAVHTCVHCGFCLAACPTYQEFGQEMDSPRGRIVLMKQVLEGELAPADAQLHIDRCLGCLACEPACPSGVVYRDLISPFRAEMESRRVFSRGAGARFRRWITARTIPFPARFRKVLHLAQLARPLRFITPKEWRSMLDLAPGRVPAAVALQPVYPAQRARRGRVALLAGCAQQVLDPDINVATIDVLTRNGIEVVVPAAQGCCGGLAWHTGDLEAARSFARMNLTAFPSDVDAIVTNAAGCGSTMREYGTVLRGTAEEARAQTFHSRVVDVSVYLARVGLRESPRGSGGNQRIAYHDACHLANAQGVRAEPRALLRAIPGVELIDVPDAHLCCGSAGTYNIEQPVTAASLGEKKARAVMNTGADVVASGNIGCMTQLRVHLEKLGSPVRIRHTMQVLRDAYGG
jgi:glycolate oxidase iron-sulfur subunit